MTGIVTTKPNISSTAKAGTCIGCGCCAAVCPAGAIAIQWTKRSEYAPRVDDAICSGCGFCLSICPDSPATLRKEAEQVAKSPDPWVFGMDGAEFFLAWDPEALRRRLSASGGAVTALLRHFFRVGLIDAAIHGESADGGFGAPHFRAALSRTADKCEARRGSFYHPICYANVLRSLPGKIQQAAIVGVPCAIRAIRNIWENKSEYNAISLVTIALACSHNVNGQFTDFLAESADLPAHAPFNANLRNKDGIPDANNYNIRFTVAGRQVSLENRYRSLFTHAWREHWFAMDCCHLCSDFWGYCADITVKDAWGQWSSDPLGKSIVILRNPRLRDMLQKNPELFVEPLEKSVVTRCQEATVDYKQIRILDRFNKPVWSRENRDSGYMRFRLSAFLSKMCYTRTNAAWTKKLIFALLGRPRHSLPGETSDAEITTKPEMNRLRGLLRRQIRRYRRSIVVCWGTGTLGREIARALSGRISYFVDNDPQRQGTILLGLPIQAPPSLETEPAAELLILIGSMFDESIRDQIAEMRLGPSAAVLSVGPFFWRCKKGPISRLKNRYERLLTEIRIKRKAEYQRAATANPWRRQGKILVVGGYGYRNAGDEAQLA